MKQKLPAWLVPAFSVLVFFLTGLALIPFPGLQNDELFFAGPLYYADAAFYSLTLAESKIPVMVMSYSGALKTWVYAGLFQFFEPNEWSVRVPMLLAGMATIWLTWAWVRRIAGFRAAAVTVVLLSTDTIFQLTNTFDWGPVAFQHLFLMAGLVAFGAWLRRGSSWLLAAAFFIWGLGLWDKALLVWPLSGLALAALLCWPREVLRRLRLKPALIALAAFLLGAAPLVDFNIEKSGATATDNAHFTGAELPAKLVSLRGTVDGSGLFGYMVYPNDPNFAVAPLSLVGRAARRISLIAGNHTRNAMLPAFGAAFLCFLALLFPRAPEARFLLFLLVVSLCEWLQMAITRNTGNSAHHVILIWPFPVVFLAVAFDAAAARIPRRGTGVLTVVTLFLAAANLLNTNEYLKDFAVYGAAGGWTDAIYRLSDSVAKSAKTSQYGLVDWGCLNALWMLHEGDLPLFIAHVPAEGVVPQGDDRQQLLNEIGAPDHVFISHTDERQMFPGINLRLRAAAHELGYEEKIERVIHDRNGRPVFELFRFQKLP